MTIVTQTPAKTNVNTAIDSTGSFHVAAQNEVPPLKVIRRNGEVTGFDQSKITVAIGKAFIAVEGQEGANSSRFHEITTKLSDQVVSTLTRQAGSTTIHIESIQDQVELALMRQGYHQIARAYVLYRDAHTKTRKASAPGDNPRDTFTLTLQSGEAQAVSYSSIQRLLEDLADGLTALDISHIESQLRKNLFDGIPVKDLKTLLLMIVRNQIVQDPEYARLAARLMRSSMSHEAFEILNAGEHYEETTGYRHFHVAPATINHHYPQYFKNYIRFAVDHKLLDAELARYDLERLAGALLPERDLQFDYLGLQTLYDRYFIRHEESPIELPQAFFMRVAMGLAINEVDRESRAIEFYLLLSSFQFMCSTPTLFNAGTPRPQLSSCYLTTVPDDLDGIFSAIKDNALLSKYAGGLGNDWTPVRGLGARISGTQGKSQGVVPFLKVNNDTAVAVNQGGKRKGAICAYLETWHIDIEEFLDLRKNTGDERRRTHDMNTANWIPDLFMERVIADQEWTLLSPDEAPDLHELYGAEFRRAYEAYEEKAKAGLLINYRVLSAKTLWRKMLGQLFETGHPWITFKDPCNQRYTNQHQGVVHSSNLCTEITLHTSAKEIAVCNLGSVNLAAHINEGKLDTALLQSTVTTAMRMLDNVIDTNLYAVPQARTSNLRHRPVGLGLMGFQDALYLLDIPIASDKAIQFADNSMEAISYYAIESSMNLARERGRYPSYEGSLWSQGVLPIDSLDNLADRPEGALEIDRSQTFDWAALRTRIKTIGMRNSNCLAIAPTATIANICGVSQSIEPTYQNLYVKSNLSGEFTVVNKHLVKDLKDRALWDSVMVNDLKYYDGSLRFIDRIPADLKQKYATAFEIDSRWLIEAASRRQKWIDQAQSLNLYLAEPDGRKLDDLYRLAWVRGLKTTYYLRSLGATQMEKAPSALSTPNLEQTTNAEGSSAVCAIDNPDCEACQ